MKTSPVTLLILATMHARHGEKRITSRLRDPFALLICAVTLPVVACSVSSCVGGKLTRGAEQAILTGELVLCDVVTASPAACQDSEAAFKALLDQVTVAAPSRLAAAPTHPLLRTPKGYALFVGSRQVGAHPDASVAMRAHTPEVQAALALLVADAGKDGR